MAEEKFYSALHWAKKAEASAKLAAENAQSGGKIPQLGFDGSMEDGQLVFKHAPGGVEAPYQLVDDVEYELDLAYAELSELPSATQMIVKNGDDTITFVSAEHRSSTEPATVGDMKAVMRYNSDTGYRWLFKAAYKITPAGTKVLLLYPVVASEEAVNSKITNCITEIPQDIKLELADGVLTLKAGSKVYVPNGVGKFDEVVIASDLTYSIAGTLTGKTFMIYNAGKLERMTDISTVFSGDTQPSSTASGAWWYDTSANVMKGYSTSTSSWNIKPNVSLPIALVTMSNGSATSIDQVFNGFGYIGGNPFETGFKGLASDGYNKDGTYKNIEVTGAVFVHPLVGTGTFYLQAVVLGVLTTTLKTRYYKQPTPPAFVKSACWEDTQNNVIWKSLAASTGWTNGTSLKVINVGEFVSENNSITSFTPKLPFRAVDRNDSSWIAQQAMPSSKYIDLTLGASGSTYTAPANGWFYIAGQANASGQYIQISTSASERGRVSVIGAANQTAQVEFPVLKGKEVVVYYSVTTNRKFRFFYAEGEN